MSRLICESCDHGYAPTAQCCRWCGASSGLAHISNDVAYLDTECYPNYWLCLFSTGESFELWPDAALDVEGLKRALSRYTVYTFNGTGYDVPMIAGALSGKSCDQLKSLSDLIIKSDMKWWQLPGIDWIDHVDIMQVAPGAGSLKMYGAKMHMPVLQDLPYDPDLPLDWYEIMRVREYCGNDVAILQRLCEVLKPALELRETISLTEGLDVRSKSGPQVAETVFKKLINRKIQVPVYRPGFQFYFKPAGWMRFHRLNVLEILARCPFTITESGHAKLADELGMTVIEIGNTDYQMGAGGLHSKESCVSHHATKDESLTDFDVASMYPATIINLGIYPAQISEQFKIIYKGWRDDRLKDKHEGRAQDADAKKLFLNGIFGKLLERHSIFYAPIEGMQVTISCQIALLMLIESLELCGISVVSANTDGVLIKCKRELEPLRDLIIKQWEAVTNYQMESTEYKAIYSRDVNNYIAVKSDGGVKVKGIFAEPAPTASNWPAPSGQICITAIIEFFIKGVAIEETIKSCQDFKQFIYVRAVKRGGEYVEKPQFTKKPSKKYANEVLAKHGFTDYDALLEWSQNGAIYLGKVVRWYYATGSAGSIRYVGSGNLVARTDGCKPAMMLPETKPDDLNYDWYVKEAESILKDIEKVS